MQYGHLPSLGERRDSNLDSNGSVRLSPVLVRTTLSTNPRPPSRHTSLSAKHSAPTSPSTEPTTATRPPPRPHTHNHPPSSPYPPQPPPTSSASMSSTTPSHSRASSVGATSTTLTPTTSTLPAKAQSIGQTRKNQSSSHGSWAQARTTIGTLSVQQKTLVSERSALFSLSLVLFFPWMKC